MRARDVMTAHPSVITPDDSVRKAAQIMRDRNVDVLPVLDSLKDRHLRGMLTDRDIVVRCIAAGRSLDEPVREFMTTHHLATVRVDDDVIVVAAKMRRSRVRRVPVLAADDHVEGLVAMSDLASRLRPADPALVAGLERVPSRAVHMEQ